VLDVSQFIEGNIHKAKNFGLCDRLAVGTKHNSR
jgi:hypothetical protein